MMTALGGGGALQVSCPSMGLCSITAPFNTTSSVREHFRLINSGNHSSLLITFSLKWRQHSNWIAARSISVKLTPLCLSVPFPLQPMCRLSEAVLSGQNVACRLRIWCCNQRIACLETWQDSALVPFRKVIIKLHESACVCKLICDCLSCNKLCSFTEQTLLVLYYFCWVRSSHMLIFWVVHFVVLFYVPLSGSTFLSPSLRMIDDSDYNVYAKLTALMQSGDRDCEISLPQKQIQILCWDLKRSLKSTKRWSRPFWLTKLH